MNVYLADLRKRHTTPLLLSIVTTTFSLPVQAQTGATLEEVVVSAQRREENAQEVPVSVVVMDQEALSRSQVNSVMDLPHVAPSLNFENRGVGTARNFSMRGVGAFAPNLSIQPGVGLVVDEVGFGRSVEYDVDLSDIASVQFVNGPQGTLFGANNIGGVVLITTPQPTQEFEGYVEGSVSSDDEYIMRGVVSGPLTERVSARLLVYTREREGYITNLYPLADVSGADRRGGEESQGARLKVGVDLTDNLQLTLIGDYRHTYNTDTGQYSDFGAPTAANFVAVQGNGDPVLGARVASDPKLINTDIPPYSLVDTWGTSANLTWSLSDAVTLKSITAYRETETFQVTDIDASPASIANPQGVALVQASRSNRGIYAATDGMVNVPCGCNAIENFKQELRLEYSNNMFDAVLGAFYLKEDIARPDDVPAMATGGIPTLLGGTTLSIVGLSDTPTTLKSWAGFGDLTWHVSDALDLFAGYRWTNETLDLSFYNRTLRAPAGRWSVVGDVVTVNPAVVGTVTAFEAEADNGEWSGRAGFLWKTAQGINVYGSVARGFTGAGIVATATSPANAFVAPTTAVSYELGAKSTLLDDRLRLNVALFRNNLQDIQSSLYDVVSLQNVVVNAGDFRSQGVELDLTALLGERLTLNAVATLMETELTSDVFEPCYFQQTAAQGCVAINPTTSVQNVKGKPGIDAPDLKYTLGGTYSLPFPSRSFEGRAGIAYTWTDERYYELIFDPVASLAPSYGTVDLNFGITDKQGRYDISLFGKNVLDEHYVTFGQSDVGRNARARAAYSRASFAYWGIKAKFNF